MIELPIPERTAFIESGGGGGGGGGGVVGVLQDTNDPLKSKSKA